MGKLFVFMGKSASGKDTLYREIMSRHTGIKKVIPYTTRPIREGESEGEEYHFVTEERLFEMEKAGQVVECRRYETVRGPWYYFTAEDGQIDLSSGDYCLISTLEGFEKIRDFYGEDKVIPLYIEVPDIERMRRALVRESLQKSPCVAEVCRRFLADEEDFSEEKLRRAGVEKTILNMEREAAVGEIEREMLQKERKCPRPCFRSSLN